MLDFDFIIEAHKAATGSYQDDVRDKNLLESIPKQIYQEVYGEILYPTVKDKISFVVASIIKNHCFTDGNKRTAALLYDVLCESNDIESKPDAELFDASIEIASSKFDVQKTKSLLF